jgi:sugar lactone lactonase YvrE
MRRALCLLTFLLTFAALGSAQIIQTVAGGGPNNLPAVDANILPFGVAVDGAGNLYTASPNANRVYKVDPSGQLTIVAGNGTPGFSGDGGPATSATLFTPKAVAVDAVGNIYIADTSNQRIRKVDSSGIITTAAGNGTYGFSGDGGPATGASLYSPSGVALDAAGNIYIADSRNHRIRKVDTSGIITTVAGNGTFGFSGDGGPATSATLSDPYGVAVDAAGNLYIVDQLNNRIRKVDTSGTIATVAGNGTPGFSGDNGPATSASLYSPSGVAVDAAGNLYIADTSNQRIRKVDTSGIITTVAGNGTGGYSGDSGPATSASLNYPYGVAVDAAGNLYIADESNQRIRKVDTSGIITTVAGNGTAGYSGDDGPAISATLYYPRGVAVDASGNLYIADLYNQRVRMVDTAGIITTIAGNCTYGFSGDGGPATSAMLAYPSGVAVNGAGDIFVADLINYRVRKIIGAVTAPAVSLSPTSLDFGDSPVGTETVSQTVTLTSSGNTALHIASVSVTGDFRETDNCASATLAVGDSCGIAVSFLPTAAGSATGTLTITDDTADSPQMVNLTGTGTITTIATMPNQDSYEGSFVNLPPAQFTDTDPSHTHTATVNWGDGNTSFGTVTESAGTGTVQATHAYGDNGTYVVTVTVDDNAAGSASSNFTVTVANVAPTVSSGITGNAYATVGSVFSLTSASFSDPGFNNPAGGTTETFTAQIDFGDGSPGVSGNLTAIQGSQGVPTTGAIPGSKVYQSAGTFAITICVTDDDGGEGCTTLDVIVSGIPSAHLSSSNLSFGNQAVGSTSQAASVILTSSGTAALTITSITASGDYALTTTGTSCPYSGGAVAVGATCTIDVTFAPTQGGDADGRHHHYRRRAEQPAIGGPDGHRRGQSSALHQPAAGASGGLAGRNGLHADGQWHGLCHGFVGELEWQRAGDDFR